MSSIAVIAVLIVVLAVAFVAAWLWGERKEQAAREQGAKTLSDLEGQSALLNQQLGSVSLQLASTLEEKKARELALDSAQEEFTRRELDLRERASKANERIAALEERLTSVNAQDADARLRRQEVEAHLEKERNAQKGTLASLEGERQKLLARERSLDELREKCGQVVEKLAEQEAQNRVLLTRLAQSEADLAAQRQIVAQTKDIEKTFAAKAAEVLQKSGSQLSEQQFKQIEATLAPLKESLGGFKKQVEDGERARQKEQGQLDEKLKAMMVANTQLNQGAQDLTRALKGDNKIAGGWGEVVLERVLEDAGLQKGREYTTQESKKNEDGKVLRPDVVIQLPEEKCLIVDSKVSLKHWEARVAEECDWATVENSVRQHLRGLSSKNYEDLHGAKSVDYVLMFLPIEPLFLELARRSPALLKEAWDKRVMIVGPSTLQWALRSVHAIWQFERQNKNAQEIARQAGAMHDKFVGFLKNMAEVEKALKQAQTAYAEASSKLQSGRGNLIGSAHKLTLLGAPTKKPLPVQLVESCEPASGELLEIEDEAKFDSQSDSPIAVGEN